MTLRGVAALQGRIAGPRSRMEVGMDQGYATLHALLAVGGITGTAGGVEA